MIQSTRAIVRANISGLKAGTVVRVSSLAFESGFGRRFPVTPDTRPDPLLWIEPHYLLPMSRFKEDQPQGGEYWELIYSRARVQRDPKKFISDPNTEATGLIGFKFESLGELKYYVNLHDMDIDKFEIAHMQTGKFIREN